MYTKKVMDYFMHPKNVGEIEKPDGVGKVGNPVCGDIMWLYIKIGEKNGKKIIKESKFKTLGCAAAIATSSIITEMAVGKTIDEALEITKEDVTKQLGGLPHIKIHCSLLSTDALSEAIYDYLTKTKQKIPSDLQTRHKKLQDEFKEMEIKYKEFVEAQKKMFEKK